jgi:hypothetical protein
MNLLEIGADIAEIATATVAVIAYSSYRLDRWRKHKAVEKYLRDAQRLDGDPGERSVAELICELTMTEDQVFDAVFRNKRLWARLDERGSDLVSRLYVKWYDGQPDPN